MMAVIPDVEMINGNDHSVIAPDNNAHIKDACVFAVLVLTSVLSDMESWSVYSTSSYQSIK